MLASIRASTSRIAPERATSHRINGRQIFRPIPIETWEQTVYIPVFPDGDPRNDDAPDCATLAGAIGHIVRVLGEDLARTIELDLPTIPGPAVVAYFECGDLYAEIHRR